MSGPSPLALAAVVTQVRREAARTALIAIGGAGGLAEVLRRELVRDGDPSAVRTGGPEGASAFALVLAAPPTEDDERALRVAHRARVPIVCVLAGPELDTDVPYVLATDVLQVPAGSGFPVDEIARTLAGRLGRNGVPLAARLPVVRAAITRSLIEHASRRAGMVAVASWLPGADLPALAVLQVQLVLQIGACYGQEIDAQRAPEILAVIGGGFGLRAVARRTLRRVPLASWLVKAGFAYGGTRAIGEAAIRYFEARTLPGQTDGRQPISLS